MTTHRSAVRLSRVLLFALSTLATAPRAWAQQAFTPGIYRGVENGTGNTFLFRLETLPQEAGAPFLIGTVFNLEGGTYRVFAGTMERGGLHNFYSNLCLAPNQSAAAQVLAAPGSAFVPEPSGGFILNSALINTGYCCQVDALGVGSLHYGCSGGHIGTLELLRP